MRCHKMCYHTVLLVLVELHINSIKLIRSTYTTLLTDFNISASQLHKLFNFKLSHEIRTFSKPTDIKLHCPSCSIHYIWRIKMVKEETDKLNLSINEIRLNNSILCISARLLTFPSLSSCITGEPDLLNFSCYCVKMLLMYILHMINTTILFSMPIGFHIILLP